jgi:NAD(P)H-hydrate repair Nnr-like enzyme with NAD(P)H-hydrate dehydratase domain
MSVIVRGTVVYWEVVHQHKVDERVIHKDDAVVSVYLTDDAEDADESALVSKYTLDQIDKVAVGPPAGDEKAQLDKAKKLLKAACQGLLRAGGITRSAVTSPSAP